MGTDDLSRCAAAERASCYRGGLRDQVKRHALQSASVVRDHSDRRSRRPRVKRQAFFFVKACNLIAKPSNSRLVAGVEPLEEISVKPRFRN